MKILIIEDDPLWQKIFKLYLEKKGEIQVARNLAEVEYHLAMFKPSIVVADIHLERHSMIDYFGQKEDKTYPILFTTSFLSDEILEKACQIPHSLFISKPVERLTLESSITYLSKYFLSDKEHDQKIELNLGIWTKNKFNQSILIPFEEIIFIKCEGNYSFIQTSRRVYTFKRSLTRMVSDIPTYFVRISKFIVVNTNLPIEYQLIFNELKIGEYTFKVGRSYRSFLLSNIQNKIAP